MTREAGTYLTQAWAEGVGERSLCGEEGTGLPSPTFPASGIPSVLECYAKDSSGPPRVLKREVKEPVRAPQPHSPEAARPSFASGPPVAPGLSPARTEGALWGSAFRIIGLMRPAARGLSAWAALAKEGDWSPRPPQAPSPKHEGLRLVTEQW